MTRHYLVALSCVAALVALTSTVVGGQQAPRTPWGTPGPYEEAVLNTPIVEDFKSPEDFQGIDILRTIRSFDPCMPGTTHIFVEGQDKVVTREVTTCACGVE